MTDILASAEEIEAYIAEEFASDPDAANFQVEELSADMARVRLTVYERHLRPGRTVGGPTLMKVADTGAFALLLGVAGLDVPMATSSLDIHFLRRPEPGYLVAEAKMLRWGRTLAVVSVQLYSGGADEAVAHATVTYRMARPDPVG